MDSSVNYLIRIIDSEVKHSMYILDFLREKEQILIKNETSSLKSFLEREHSFFVKSKELEASRFSVLEVIARKFNINKHHVSLHDIITHVNASLAKKIKDLKIRLRDILLKVEAQNKKCELLIKKSMEIIDFSISLMSQSLNSNIKTIYDKDCRRINGSLTTRLVDQKG